MDRKKGTILLRPLRTRCPARPCRDTPLPRNRFNLQTVLLPLKANDRQMSKAPALVLPKLLKCVFPPRLRNSDPLLEEVKATRLALLPRRIASRRSPTANTFFPEEMDSPIPLGRLTIDKSLPAHP